MNRAGPLGQGDATIISQSSTCTSFTRIFVSRLVQYHLQLLVLRHSLSSQQSSCSPTLFSELLVPFSIVQDAGSALALGFAVDFALAAAWELKLRRLSTTAWMDAITFRQTANRETKPRRFTQMVDTWNLDKSEPT